MNPIYRSLSLAGLALLVVEGARANQPSPPAVAIQMVQIPAESTAMPGAILRYIIVYTNNTAGAISGAAITAPLPSVTHFMAASLGVAPAAGALTWNLPPVDPGQTGSVAFLATVDGAAAVGTTINAQATVTVPSLSLVLPSNTVTTTVAGPPSLTGRLKLNGSAMMLSDTAIRLVPNTTWQHGSAWLIDRQPVAGGFQSLFQFRITDLGGNRDSTGADGGDGLTFVIQNSSRDALGGAGGNIGYGGIPNSLAVEFDVWLNGTSDLHVPDLPNEISVHTRGTMPNSPDEQFSLGRVTAGPNMKDGRTHLVSVFYQPGLLEIFLDQLAAPALIVPVDLSRVLHLAGGQAWVGFTASTGDAFANHDVLSWQFEPGPF